MLQSNRSNFRKLAVSTLLATFTVQSFGIGHAALQLGIPMASAQIRPPASQRANSNVIQLLLAASREENPVRALELLKLAREEVKKEHLAQEDVDRISAIIEDLEKKAQSKIDAAKAASTTTLVQQSSTPTYAGQVSNGAKLPTTMSLGNSTPNANAGSSAVTKPVEKEIEKSLTADPEIRDLLWEIGRSRLARDTNNLSEIVKERTGETPEQIDLKEETLREAAEKPGALLGFLDSIGILKLDVGKANLKLKQEYDGIALDVLADQLIGNAIKFSIGAGALRGAVTDKGALGNYGGLTLETVGTLAVNAKLVLRLADLYGVEMDETERQMVLNLVFLAFKVGLRYGIDSKPSQSMFASLGAKIADAKNSAGGWMALMKQIASNKTVAAAAGPEAGALLSNIANVEAAKPAVALGTTSPTNAPTTPAADPPATKSAKLKAFAEKFKLMQLFRIVAQGALSGSETYAVGRTAKFIFSGMRLERRKIYNENFRRFLMTPIGEGFFKLLILSMNDGRPSIGITQNSRNTSELKAKSEFIANLARSARACSEEELKLLKANGTSTQLSYACSGTGNTARSERIKTEYLTFDAIPQDYVADLRTAARENRLRMGELVLQMQFLDGDRSPSEVQFFRSIIVKALGLDNVGDLEYFERLHAYIQENGGVVPAHDTPTGVTILPNNVKSPYNMERGYQPLNAPEPAAAGGETSAKPTEKKK